jgi:hypothetical protein
MSLLQAQQNTRLAETVRQRFLQGGLVDADAVAAAV